MSPVFCIRRTSAAGPTVILDNEFPSEGDALAWIEKVYGLNPVWTLTVFPVEQEGNKNDV